MKTSDYRRQIMVWIVLAAIVTAYAISVRRINPAAYFGMSEDDAIYFSSAKAMADGHGYVLSSVPGTPAATKYPVLYPWLLSMVWKLNPSFPANLSDAVDLNILFGAAFIVGAFFFFREIGHLEDPAALALSAFCGLHPTIILHTVNIVPEIAFAALTIWALVTASRAINDGRSPLTAAVCGVLAGCSILTRVLGIPVAAGIFVALAYRRAWRGAIAFGASVVPFVAALIWRSIISAPANAPALSTNSGVADCARAWQMSWMYHTNYLALYKSIALHDHALWGFVKQNLLLVSLQPGMYFLDPGLSQHSLPIYIAALLLSVAVWKRLILHARKRLEPVHVVLVFYLIPVILWDYPIVARFLIPFLPLMVLGLWLEVRSVAGLIGRTFHEETRKGDRPAAVFLCAVMLILAALVGASLRFDLRSIVEKSKVRTQALGEKRAAYAWLRSHTPADSRVIAYEDASLFLYAGRQSFRPVIFSPGGDFAEAEREPKFPCMTASAEALDAGYWLISDDDFGMEPGDDATAARTREREFESIYREVFKSDGGRVRIIRTDQFH